MNFKELEPECVHAADVELEKQARYGFEEGAALRIWRTFETKVEKVGKVGECSESRPLSVTYFTHPLALPPLAEPPLILTMFINLLHFDLILLILPSGGNRQ